MRKRSKYRPRHINPQAHITTMKGVQYVDDYTIKTRCEALQSAIDAACRTQADEADWRRIFDAVNVIDAVCKLKLADGDVEPIKAIMETACDRRKETGSMALRMAERESLKELAEVYANVLPHLTMAQLYQAEELVAATVARALAGDVAKGVRVIEWAGEAA